MDFPAFKRHLLDVVQGLEQAHLAATVASTVLADFPRNLPEQLRGPLTNALRSAAEEVSRALSDSTNREVHLNLESGSLEFSTMLMLATGVCGANAVAPDFSRPLFIQCLVMALAQVDGFLNECLRVACQREPNLLRRDKKQVSWNEVIEAGSWRALLESIIEQFSFEFGWNTLQRRIELLRESLGLKIDINDRILNSLEAAYQVRHVVVHNGGRASAEFLKRTQRIDLKVGDSVPVTERYTTWVIRASQVVCSEVFVATALKFFESSEIDWSGIWMQSQGVLDEFKDLF